MPAVKSSRKNQKSFFQVNAMIRRCDQLKFRIRNYQKLKGITQAQFADEIHVGKGSMSNFMRGTTGVESDAYVAAHKYLKTRMPLSKCSEDVNFMSTGSKYTISISKMG